MVREEEVGRSETHEMATLQPHSSIVTSAALPVPTGQKEHPLVSQADAEARVSSTAPCCCIPTGVSRSFTSTCSRSNIDLPQHNIDDATSDQPTRAGQSLPLPDSDLQGPSQAEAQTRVYFPIILETLMTWWTQNLLRPIIRLPNLLLATPLLPLTAERMAEGAPTRRSAPIECALHWITISSIAESEVTLDHDFNLGWDEVHDHSFMILIIDGIKIMMEYEFIRRLVFCRA
jgi:hypothetical protein